MKAKRLLPILLLTLVLALSVSLLAACGHEHQYSKAITTEATCESKGLLTYTCACGESYTEETAALGHNLQTHQAQNANCNQIGWDTYEACTRCDYTTYQEKPITSEHTWDGGIITAPSTCSAEGSKTITCTTCGATRTETVEKLQHILQNHAGKPATCTEDGWDAYQTCQRTGCTYSTQQIIPATSHSWDNGRVTKQPTCTTKGAKTFTCTKCLTATRIVDVDALEHDIKTYQAQEPTCTKTGWAEYQKCQRADCTYSTKQTIPATGHSYNSVDTKPTCTTQGYTTHTCVNCNDTYTIVYANALQHNYTSKITTEPTCTTDGVKTYTCANDSTHTYTEVVPATGHSYNSVVTNPTCTTQGYTTNTCRKCNNSYIDGYVDALQHSYTSKVTTEPTCTTAGVKTYTCINDSTHTYTEVVPATGHSEKVLDAVAPTCTATGLTAGKQCTTCNVITVAQTVVQATGHTEVVDAAAAPTCTATGLTEGKHCSVCKTILVAQQVVDALGHSDGAVVVENNVAPTCTAYGSYDNATYCTVCKAETSRSTVTVDVLGHDHVRHDAQAPTCTQIGWNTYDTCSRCNYSTYQQIPATGIHTWDTGIVTKKPTCIQYGTKTFTCTVCLTATRTEDVDVVDHTLQTHEAKAPTCTQTGWDEYVICTQAGCYYTTYKEIPATGIHTWDNGKTTTKPTCTTEGTKTFTCTVCLTATRTEDVESLGHDQVSNSAQAATCEAVGWDDYTTCRRCEYTTYQEKPALGHKEVTDKGVAPTCTTTGLTTGSHCLTCNKIFVAQQVVDALGHDYNSVVTAPTCTERGYTTHTCKNDATHKYTDSYVVATGHSEKILDPVAPTCTTTGLTIGKQCTTCNVITLAQTVVSATGHTNGSVVEENNVAPTCTTTGSYDNVTYCTVCKVETSRTKVTVDATGHNYNAVVTAPTCTERGYTTHTCTNDASHTYVDSYVDELGHDKVTHEAQIVTCKQVGWEAYETCSRCDYTTYAGAIPMQHNTNGTSACLGCGLAESTPGLEYSQNADGTYTMTGIGSCTETSIVISFHNGKDVTSIDYEAFYKCSSLTSVTIGNGVTSIGIRAFRDCDSLTSIVIPDSVTYIGYYAFEGCTSLTSIAIPDSVTDIGGDAFYNTAYYNDSSNWVNDVLYIGKHLIKAKVNISGTYTVKAGTLTIAGEAFSGCTSLTGIVIPDSVTSVGSSAFYNCTSLTKVNITDIAAWCKIEFAASYSNPLYRAGKLYLNGNLVTTLVIPDGVTSIGNHAFEGCTSLTGIVIPDSVTSIGDYAFYGCTSLTGIIIPDSVTSIGYGAFGGCTSLTGIIIPDSVTSIDYRAFYECTSLTGIVIPDSVTSIDYRAFEGCTKLTSIVIPDSVTSIGDTAFYNTAYYNDSSNWVNNVLYIGKHLIKAKVNISGTYTVKAGTLTIAGEAFSGCTSLTGIVIPDSVTSIGYRAFEGCTKLTSVTIGNGVTSIGNNAFSGCTSLTKVNITDVAAWCKIEFASASANPLCFAGKLYLNGNLVTELVIPDSVTSIGKYAFYNCTSLTSIKFTDASNWYRTTSQNEFVNKTGGTYTDLTSTYNNVVYFKSVYYEYYWYKK